MQKIGLEGWQLFGELVAADVAEEVPSVVVVVVSHCCVATLYMLAWARVLFVATGVELEERK